MNIATASSYEYAYYGEVMLLSLFENNKENKFDVYYGYIDDRVKSIIEDMNVIAQKWGNKVIPIK